VPSAQTSDTAASAEVSASPVTPPAVVPPAAVGPERKGLAAGVCPAGPYAAAPTGALTATALPGTEPTALDPKDKAFHLYEGAVWLGGVLYFSDFKTSAGFPSRILSYTPGQGLKVALPDSGTNGIALDATGQHLVGARHKSKSVASFSADLKTVTDVAAKYQGKKFNSPNDAVFRSDGNLYFTDPDFQAGPRKDQATTNVYRVSPSGEVSVVDASIANPNGISLAVDESALYVAGNLEQGYVKRYPIAADGSVGEGAIFAQPVVVPDGMAFDCAGNLYVTEHTQRRVRVFAADGKEIAVISGLDKNVTNVAFGGAERRTLFLTTTGGLYSIELPIPGLPY
jgi:gluconolactonase